MQVATYAGLLLSITMALCGCDPNAPEPDRSTAIGRELYRHQHTYRAHVERHEHPQADKLRTKLEAIDEDQEQNPMPSLEEREPKYEYQVLEITAPDSTVMHGSYPGRQAARELRDQLRENDPAGHYVISQVQNH